MHQPAADAAHDLRSAALLALLVVAQVAVLALRHEEHRAAAGHLWRDLLKDQQQGIT